MINNIGIIGEGKMGTNILYYLVDMDFNITWICSPEADLEKIQKHFDKRMSRALDAGILDEARHSKIMKNVRITHSIEAAASCELIIEAVSENGEVKRKVFAALDLIADPDCIFTSNSSSFNPSELIPSEKRKTKFTGLHFFYPVALKDIVEVIRTQDTSEETIQKIIRFLGLIRRKFILLEEKDSFILNRIFLQFQNEAFLLVKDNKASFEQIDRIVKEAFFPSGIFEFFDSVGLDVMLASVRNYSKGDPDEERYQPLILQLQELVSMGRLGMKTKKGFYGDDIAPDPGYPENEKEIIKMLHTSYISAFQRFSKSSGIQPAVLKSAMDEYFGADTPPVLKPIKIKSNEKNV